ncbi:MAG: DUF2779 domain-containing protein [Leptospira sp.]|nr:DUF2779 domain-containing protein [Leptospira sp.]
MKLTKSLFIEYLDSPLHMWLKSRSEVTPKPVSVYDQHIMKQGYEIEKLAKVFLEKKVAREYPAGTTISFEETLTDGNYQSRIDALVHDKTNNTYDLYEIKSSTTIHTEHKYDVTFQYLVGKATLSINKTYLVIVNSDYRRDGEIDLQQLFVIEDMEDEIAKKEDEVYQLRSDAWSTLRLETIPSDEHCFNPGTCSYPTICFPELPAYPIYDLNRGSKKQYAELIDMGVGLIKDIPDTFKTSTKQKLQIQSIRSGKPIIKHEAIKKQLDGLEFPLYFLDYETYAEALPMYDNYGPYQQITTQFSIHVAESPESSEFKHYEFLAREKDDPAPELAKALCDVIGETGTIIVWNKGFECGRNEELGALVPEYAEQLASINKRTFDLMEVFSKGLYVDNKFHGSASIKKVLPILAPELSYKTLEIGEGATAMIKWHEMVYGDIVQAERDAIASNLLTYCKLDTWAMVEIWRELKKILT